MDNELFYFTDKVPSLSKARKDYTPTGQPYDEDDPNSISEWQLSYAKTKAGGDSVTVDQFGELIEEAKTQQTLDDLCEKDYIESIWENGELKYKLTAKGRKYIENEFGQRPNET